MIRTLLAFILTLVLLPLSATHLSGGEIYYECLGNDQYAITLIIYRDCAGVQLDPSFDVDLQSPCDTFQVQVNTPSGVELSQLCDLQLPNSTCNGGTLPGIQQYTYSTVVTLPPCSSWTISWSLSNRNGAVANLMNPNNQQMFIQATLDNTVDACDDSPQFTATATPYVCLNYPVTYSLGAFDAEGDSLTYTLINAMGQGGSQLAYVNPYSATQPIGATSLDPQTGLLSFTPTQPGNWVVVVQVNEYDTLGNLIGTVMRDMQFVAYPCSNVPPDASTGTITNPSGTATVLGSNAIQVCESGSFCFDMVISDANPGNVLDAVSNVSSVLPGATFSFSGTNPITCSVCWNGTNATSGFYPFVVTVDDGACPIPALQTYAYTVQVLDGVFIQVQATDASCLGNSDGTAAVTVNDGLPPYQFSWSNLAATTPVVSAGAGTYTVTVTDANGCVSAPGTAIINAPAPPTANAGPDVVACSGNYPISLVGAVSNAATTSWSGGAGTLTSNGVNATYTPTPGEILAGGLDLMLTATSGNACPNAFDLVHIALSNSFQNAQVSATNALCFGSASGSLTFSPALPGNTYVWSTSPPQNGPVATGLSAGTYLLTVSDSLGCDTTLSAAVAQPASLSMASLTGTDETCAGLGNGSAVVQVTGGTAPYAYTWSNGATTDSISVGAGTYTVSVTDANGCAPVSASVTIASASQPNEALAGADQVICNGSWPVNLTGSVVNATGGTWSGGGQFTGSGLNVSYMPGPAQIAAGQVDLVLTTTGNIGCPPDQDTVRLFLSDSFQGATVVTTPSCSGQNNGTALYQPAMPGLSYSWGTSPVQTTPGISGLAAGTYQVTVTDALGCDTTLTAVVSAPPPLVAASMTVTQPTCSGLTNGSATVSVNGGTPGYTYAWSSNAGGQSTPTATGLGQGTYNVVITDANGCTTQSTAQLTSPPPLVLSANVPDTVCVNAMVQMTATASGGTAPLTVNWAGIGMGSPVSYSFPANQQVNVSVTDANGCSGPTLTYPVFVLDLNDHQLVPSSDTTVCPGGSAVLTAAVPGYPGALTFTWPSLGLTGAGPHVVNVANSQAVPVQAYDACGQLLSGSITITLETPPVVTLPPLIAEGCAPLTVTMPGGLATGPLTYLWDLGDGSTSSAEQTTHTYAAGQYQVSLMVTTPAGCTSNAQGGGLVNALPGPVADFTASPWSTNMDDPTVDLTNTSTGSVQQWLWSFGDGDTSAQGSPSHTYSAPGSYPVSLWVADVNGCADSIVHIIQIDPVYEIVIPTAFTPGEGGNGGFYDPSDLGNDVFYPFVEHVDEFLMRIYNRWGELIFESTDVRRGWDGNYRGQPSPQDAYVYQLWVRFVDGREVERNGDITLLR